MEARGVTDEELAEFQGTFPSARKFIFRAPPGHEDDVLDADVIFVPPAEGTMPSIFVPWIVNAEERDRLLNGGTVWLRILGAGMPPVSLSVTE